ncbi:CIA30 family protein [Kordia sp. YSTF-M3]|uniref:CIA30 family protein n=1 Tax=Kordia aestuariivivens TaxID=2759037 RepID=A0ABR7QFY7_9FLAO|nr:CIA30 family protein [Kordia aestuariivivens]MBC8757423.1 CIA30 family protein [Kordia aestuariivivens]
MTIFDFTKTSDISNWYVVNDGVMGGLSQGKFTQNEAGNGVFSGIISLENNGGFSAIRYGIGTTDISGKNTVVIRLKGDGKKYQFRLKQNSDDRYSFVTQFETSGDWEIIEIPLKSLYPTFRGQKLTIGNFSENYLEEIGFLVGNKKREQFQLELDYIELK